MKDIIVKPDSRDGFAILTIVEEYVTVQYISQLDLRGFSPSKADVEDMANLLFVKYDMRCVGKCWAGRFITR